MSTPVDYVNSLNPRQKSALTINRLPSSKPQVQISEQYIEYIIKVLTDLGYNVSKP